MRAYVNTLVTVGFHFTRYYLFLGYIYIYIYIYISEYK